MIKQDFAFMFYPGDYLRDIQCLSEKTQVVYDRIMCEHMRNICITQTRLKFFTRGLNDDEMEELKNVLIETDGGFQISWVAQSILKRIAYSESRRRNRLQSDKLNGKSYDNHMEDEDIDIDIIKNHKSAKTEKELMQFENILCTDEKEFKMFVNIIEKDIINENKLRLKNPFKWIPQTKTMHGDLHNLMWNSKKDFKKDILFNADHALKGKRNWPLYLRLVIIQMIKASEKKPIKKSHYIYVKYLIQKPGDIISSMADGYLSDWKKYLMK